MNSFGFGAWFRKTAAQKISFRSIFPALDHFTLNASQLEIVVREGLES